MAFHLAEKFNRGHLKRDGDILVGVHHDHIIGFLRGCQIGSAILHCHFHTVRQPEIVRCDIRYLLINLCPLDFGSRKIPVTVIGKGTAPKPQYHHVVIFFCVNACHHRGCQRIVIIHACQFPVLRLDGLHAEKHIGGQNRLVFTVFYLQIIIDGLILQCHILLPESETESRCQRCQNEKHDSGSDTKSSFSFDCHKVHHRDSCQNR